MTQLDAREQLALGYLEALYGPEAPGWIAIWTKREASEATYWVPAGDLEAAARQAVALSHTTNVYTGVGLRKEQLGGNKRGDGASICALAGLALDIDILGAGHAATNLPPTEEDAVALVKEFPLRPTLAVRSGHGLQVWWLFKELWVFDGEVERSQAQGLARRFNRTMQAKASAHGWKVDNTSDLARVMRIPGTVNYKTEPKPVVLVQENGNRYNPDDFEEYLLAEDVPAAARPHKPAIDGSSVPLAAVRRALDALKQERCDDYDSWIGVGMALRALGEAGLELWEEWSAKSPKHKAGECASKWQTFEADGELSVASILYWAKADSPTSREEALPEVETNGRHLRDVTADALCAVIAANEPPTVFVHGGFLARVIGDERGRHHIERLSEWAVRGEMARSADFVRKEDKVLSAGGKSIEVESIKPVPPPMDVVRDAMALGTWSLPALVGVTYAPIIRPDGSMRVEPGYDDATRLFYVGQDGLEMPTIPDCPTRDDLRRATALVAEVFCDFPYLDTASRANAMAVLLTPVVRPMIAGPVPLALFDKPQAGTGATLQADAVAVIATGLPAGLFTMPRDDAELEKRITAKLMAGETMFVLDNLEGKLFSPVLAAVLTTTMHGGRILGRSETVQLPQRATWIATGNNVQLGGDLPRRCYWIRMDAKSARPWQRSGFRHPHLLTWVRDQRVAILCSILTMARAWVVAGMPEQPTPAQMGSFEDWVRVVGGILAHAGIPDFLGNLEHMYEEADRDTPQWEAFLSAWREEWGDKTMTAAQVSSELGASQKVREALPDFLADALANRKNFARNLGNALSKQTGVRYPCGLYVAKAGTHHRAVQWRVRQDASLGYLGELGELGESGTAASTVRDLAPEQGELIQAHSDSQTHTKGEDIPDRYEGPALRLSGGDAGQSVTIVGATYDYEGNRYFRLKDMVEEVPECELCLGVVRNDGEAPSWMSGFLF